MFLSPFRINLTRAVAAIRNFSEKIDYSKYPVLIDNDLEEKFVRGSGPGGQSVNKTASAVLLRHIPTDIIVKCHMHRSLTQNRKEARKILLSKLDNHFNKENSVEAQVRAISLKKNSEKLRRQKKLKELKEKWKEREHTDEN